MCTFTTCHPEHIRLITPRPVQTEDYKAMLGDAAAEMIRSSTALTAWHQSRALGVAGVRPIWTGRAEAWSLLGEGAENFIRPIVRRMRTVLDGYPACRVEMVSDVHNTEGHKIAAMLGFTREGVMRAYHPDGSDMVLFARVRR